MIPADIKASQVAKASQVSQVSRMRWKQNHTYWLKVLFFIIAWWIKQYGNIGIKDFPHKKLQQILELYSDSSISTSFIEMSFPHVKKTEKHLLFWRDFIQWIRRLIENIPFPDRVPPKGTVLLTQRWPRTSRQRLRVPYFQICFFCLLFFVLLLSHRFLPGRTPGKGKKEITASPLRPFLPPEPRIGRRNGLWFDFREVFSSFQY